FKVEPGQTVALVGPSGGGKTTAASLIPRFWDVSSGSVLVGGVDVREADPHVLMDQVAFVFQNNRLFKTSIIENVRASRPEASREEVQAALTAAQCDDILEKLPDGMDTVIGTEGTYLSGGEQQRVALARAILKDAPIVVLDEATAFADPENEAMIQKAFGTLTKGRTVIMIAHRLSTVVGADKIIVLDSGKVSEEGTHAELVQANGLYARMWKEYNQAVKWRISQVDPAVSVSAKKEVQ
ncbi:MAG: ATP-binding cassette domain-containing protein, partial [Lachnospiraceae bacterium]|nr:ATP-binding cassette domain-containing protein [Lachnospiraceae bacterium]